MSRYRCLNFTGYRAALFFCPEFIQCLFRFRALCAASDLCAPPALCGAPSASRAAAATDGCCLRTPAGAPFLHEAAGGSPLLCAARPQQRGRKGADATFCGKAAPPTGTGTDAVPSGRAGAPLAAARGGWWIPSHQQPARSGIPAYARPNRRAGGDLRRGVQFSCLRAVRGRTPTAGADENRWTEVWR